MSELERLGHEFERALLSLDRSMAMALLTESRAGLSPIQLVEMLVVPALERIGVGWEEGRVALSQVYMGGRICEELVDTILPPADPNRTVDPKVAIAVIEDHHRLGKRVVYSALRASGFELLDYGHGVHVDDLVDRVLRDGVRILLISALMLRSALRVRDVRYRLHKSGSDVRIVVGGAPFSLDDQLWIDVQADAVGRNAIDAVRIVTRIMGELACDEHP